MKYTYLEAEAIERDYDEQVPLRVIAENVNREYHGGNPIRNENSIRYVVNKMINDDVWRSRLEQRWLNSMEDTMEPVNRQWEDDISLCHGDTEAEKALSYWMEESKKLNEALHTQQRENLTLETLIARIRRIIKIEDKAAHWKVFEIKTILKE